MGGAAGHMAHPFDCREVRNGKDLVNFYVKTVESIPEFQELGGLEGGNPASLKLDGVNASFRLKKTNDPAGFRFVFDRGATSDKSAVGKVDFDGITPDNALERFKNPEHGMIQVVNLMSKMLNHDLDKLRPYVEALGIFEEGIGPEGVFFDAEFYSNEDPQRQIKPIKNVTQYNQSFIAIHGLKDFFIEEKTSKRGKVSKSRRSRGFYWETQDEINKILDSKDQAQREGQDTSEFDALLSEKTKELFQKQREHQKILNDFAKAIAENANVLDMPFDVHTKIGLHFKEGLSRQSVIRSIEQALETKVPYNYKKINENTSVGPTVINEQTGQAQARTLKQLLLQVNSNPAHVNYHPEFTRTDSNGNQVPETAMIRVSPDMRKRHANAKGVPMSEKQSAFAKKIYMDVIENGPRTGLGVADVAASDQDFEAINNAVILWHAVRLIGNVLKDSVNADVDFGIPVSEQEGIVIQTEKICDGIPFKFTGEFIVEGGASQFRKDAPQDLSETKIKYGELIEKFIVEEQQKNVILLPGGFKPPTAGHYSMIKYYEERPDVVKVLVITGPKPRDGVTLEQSQEIFKIYGGFSNKVEFINSNDPTPLQTCYELIKNEEFVSKYPGVTFSLGAGDKGGDPKRIKEFVNYFQKRPELTNAKLGVYSPAKALEIEGQPASASRMRAAYKNQDWETFKKLLPHPSLYDNVIKVLEDTLQENFFTMDSLFSLVDEVYSEKQRKFMCAVMDKPASERPKGLSAAEAEEMCKNKGLKKTINEQQQELERSTQQWAALEVSRIDDLDKLSDEELERLVKKLARAKLDILLGAKKEAEDEESDDEQAKRLAGDVEMPTESMSGGAVQGHMAGAWVNFDEKENMRAKP